MRFKTYQDAEDYVQDLIRRNAKNIEQILYTWLTVHRTCPMMQSTASGKMGISTDKAAEHWTLVQLYDVILKNRYVYLDERTPGRNPKVIELASRRRSASRKKRSPINNDEERQKAIRAAEMHEKYVKSIKVDTKQWIETLRLNTTERALLDDFDHSRAILKQQFQAIFRLYGIDLSDKAIRYLFGSLTIEGNVYDSISLFAKGSYFPFALRYQFSQTQAGQAHGMFSAFFMRAAGLLKRFSNDPCWIDEVPEDPTYLNAHDPFFAEQKVVRILATVAACAL